VVAAKSHTTAAGTASGSTGSSTSQCVQHSVRQLLLVQLKHTLRLQNYRQVVALTDCKACIGQVGLCLFTGAVTHCVCTDKLWLISDQPKTKKEGRRNVQSRMRIYKLIMLTGTVCLRNEAFRPASVA
jgi:hypothetical protein